MLVVKQGVSHRTLWSQVMRVLCLQLALATTLLVGGCMTLESTTVNGREINKQKAAEEHVNAAMSYLASHQIGEAQRHLTRALELDGKSVSAHNALALSYNMTGEYELAEASYKKLLSLSPDYSPARNNYAAFLYQQNRFEEACKQWTRVVLDARYGKRAGAYYNLGLCHLRQHEFDVADTALQRSIALDRNNAAPYLELAQLNFGGGKYKVAEGYYSHYRKLSKGPTARSLLLGIKLAVESADDDARASRVLALKSMFPESSEYREYQRRAKHHY